MRDPKPLATALHDRFTSLLKFPRAQVCKHYAILQILSGLEDAGWKLNAKAIKALVGADDETALKCKRWAKEPDARP